MRLTRRDRLAQAVSWSLAGRTGQWRKYSDAGAPPGKDAYSFDGILSNLMRIEYGAGHWQRFFAVNGIEPFPIVYETLASDYEETLKSLFAHLAHPDARVEPPRLRRQSSAYSEEIKARFFCGAGRQGVVTIRAGFEAG